MVLQRLSITPILYLLQMKKSFRLNQKEYYQWIFENEPRMGVLHKKMMKDKAEEKFLMWDGLFRSKCHLKLVSFKPYH
jgi:hypothetical protein